MELPTAFENLRIRAFRGIHRLQDALERHHDATGDFYAPSQDVDEDDIVNTLFLLEFLKTPVTTEEQFEAVWTLQRALGLDCKALSELRKAMTPSEFSAFCEGLGALHRLVAYGILFFDLFVSDTDSVTSDM